MAGDPTLAGWLVVALYLVAAGLLYRLNGERKHLRACAAVLLALAVNKQLDLHHLALVSLRDWAQSHDLATYRRTLRGAFALSVVVLLMWVWFFLARAYGRRFPYRRWAWLYAGWTLIATFIVTRNAAFQYVFVGVPALQALDSSWLWVPLECAGPLTLCAGALWQRHTGAAGRDQGNTR